MSSQIHVDIDGAIATIRLDGPDRHNVLSGADWMELARAFRAVSGDGSLRCVVVRGTGGRAFSAGSDIALFPAQRDTQEDVRDYSAAIAACLEGISMCIHPTLALVEGLCVGGGLEIAACCDLRVCGLSSRFGAPINRLGLTMSHDELEPLLALLGPGAVLDMLLTGDLIGSEQALRAGLTSRVFADAEVVEEGYAMAQRIAAGAPLVNRWHKKFVRQIVEPYPVTAREKEEAYEAFGTEDYREGRTAFLEKRAPDFRGE